MRFSLSISDPQGTKLEIQENDILAFRCFERLSGQDPTLDKSVSELKTFSPDAVIPDSIFDIIKIEHDLGSNNHNQIVTPPYYFRVILEKNAETKILFDKNIIGSSVTFAMTGANDSERVFNGLVLRSSRRSANSGNAEQLEICAYSHFWTLSVSQKSRVWTNVDAKDVLISLRQEYLEELSDFPPIHDRRLVVGGEKRETVIQWNESDFEFVSRLLERDGEYYAFNHAREESEILLLSHNFPVLTNYVALKKLPFVPYFEKTPAMFADNVLAFSTEQKIVPKRYEIADYNPLNASTPLNHSAPNEDPTALGIFDYPAEVSIMSNLSQVAERRLNAVKVKESVYIVVTKCPTITPGHLVEAEVTFDDGELTRLRPTQVVHEIIRDEKGVSHYLNWFEAIDANQLYSPSMRTPIPSIQGTHNALVVCRNGQIADIDSKARALVIFRWDRKSIPVRVRLGQPWAGGKHGMNVLPRDGDEVLISFIQGNTERPVIVTSLHNSTTGKLYDPEKTVPMGFEADTNPGVARSQQLTTGIHNSIGNALIFSEEPGEELVKLEAYKDFILEVGHKTNGVRSYPLTLGARLDGSGTTGFFNLQAHGSDSDTSARFEAGGELPNLPDDSNLRELYDATSTGIQDQTAESDGGKVSANDYEIDAAAKTIKIKASHIGIKEHTKNQITVQTIQQAATEIAMGEYGEKPGETIYLDENGAQHSDETLATNYETTSLKFVALPAGKSFTVAGLTMTAGSVDATAEQVATAFAAGVAKTTNAGGATGARMTGSMSSYTAELKQLNREDFLNYTVTFSPLLDIGETLTIAGLTMTAGRTIPATAEQVTTAFAAGIADTSDAGGASGATITGTLHSSFEVESVPDTANTIKFVAKTVDTEYEIKSEGTTPSPAQIVKTPRKDQDTVIFRATSPGDANDVTVTGTGPCSDCERTTYYQAEKQVFILDLTSDYSSGMQDFWRITVRQRDYVSETNTAPYTVVPKDDWEFIEEKKKIQVGGLSVSDKDFKIEVIRKPNYRLDIKDSEGAVRGFEYDKEARGTATIRTYGDLIIVVGKKVAELKELRNEDGSFDGGPELSRIDKLLPDDNRGDFTLNIMGGMSVNTEAHYDSSYSPTHGSLIDATFKTMSPVNVDLGNYRQNPIISQAAYANTYQIQNNNPDFDWQLGFSAYSTQGFEGDFQTFGTFDYKDLNVDVEMNGLFQIMAVETDPEGMEIKGRFGNFTYEFGQINKNDYVEHISATAVIAPEDTRTAVQKLRSKVVLFQLALATCTTVCSGIMMVFLSQLIATASTSQKKSEEEWDEQLKAFLRDKLPTAGDIATVGVMAVNAGLVLYATGHFIGFYTRKYFTNATIPDLVLKTPPGSTTKPDWQVEAEKNYKTLLKIKTETPFMDLRAGNIAAGSIVTQYNKYHVRNQIAGYKKEIANYNNKVSELETTTAELQTCEAQITQIDSDKEQRLRSVPKVRTLQAIMQEMIRLEGGLPTAPKKRMYRTNAAYQSALNTWQTQVRDRLQRAHRKQEEEKQNRKDARDLIVNDAREQTQVAEFKKSSLQMKIFEINTGKQKIEADIRELATKQDKAVLKTNP